MVHFEYEVFMPINISNAHITKSDEMLVKLLLEELQPIRVFQWGLSRTSQIVAKFPSVGKLQIVTASKEAYELVGKAGYKLPKSEVALKDFTDGYHVMHMRMGQELYDMTLVSEETERDAAGRDWKRVRAREAFGRCIYNAKSLTKRTGVVVAQTSRGWDVRTHQEVWRWSYHRVMGDVAVMSADTQTWQRVEAAVREVERAQEEEGRA
jgi:hypothetical protein